ncbi:MAG: hypothetical protein M1812_001056 [Candelaria pacifica]|nr:MAG: hypothetical protein M1812_001056 [Candelaria pacifica]
MFTTKHRSFWNCGRRIGLHVVRATQTPLRSVVRSRTYLKLNPTIASVLQPPVVAKPPKGSTDSTNSTEDTITITVNGFLRSVRRQKNISSAAIGDSAKSTEGTITVNGFVRSVRRHKNICFAAIGDGSNNEPLQVVLTPAQAEKSVCLQPPSPPLSIGASITIEGILQPSPEGKQQPSEFLADNLQVLEETDPQPRQRDIGPETDQETSRQTYPLQKKYQTPEYLRTIPHLRSRTPFNSSLLRLRSRSIGILGKYFEKKEIWQTHPPIITSSDCEGAGEVFTVSARQATPKANIAQPGRQDEHFFRSPKYLTVSSQLHLEALAQSVGRVWALSPTFRAEGSDTSRHLSEFYMLEAELSFVSELPDIMDLVEDLLKHLCGKLSGFNVREELIHAARTGDSRREGDATLSESILKRRWESLLRISVQGVEQMWPRITYAQALQHLEEAVASKRAKFEHPLGWSLGLQSEHEKFLAQDIGKGAPIFITDYPREIKAFYMAPSPTLRSNQGPVPQGPTVACFDLLMPDIGEVAGGSMREHRLPELLDSMRRFNMTKPRLSSLTDEHPIAPDEDLGSLKWYAELRRWGSVPHGGFGLGFDRFLGYLSGVPSVRDVATFPRWPGRCDC